MQPTDILMTEHRLIEQVLNCLEKIVQQAEAEIVGTGATGWRGAPCAPAHAVGDTATARIITLALPGDVQCNPRTS